MLFRSAAEMRVSDAASFLDVVEGEDLAGEIGFDDVLEQRQHGFFEHSAAGLKVRIDVARVRGILPPVGELVRVGVEDGVQSQRLHGTHLKDSRGRGDEKGARRVHLQKGKKSGDFGYSGANRACSSQLDSMLNAEINRRSNGVVGSERRDSGRQFGNKT